MSFLEQFNLKSNFLKFCEGVCHCDIIETKHFDVGIKNSSLPSSSFP